MIIPASISLFNILLMLLSEKLLLWASSSIVIEGLSFNIISILSSKDSTDVSFCRLGWGCSVIFALSKAVNFILRASPITVYSGSGVPSLRQESLINWMPRPQDSM